MELIKFDITYFLPVLLVTFIPFFWVMRGPIRAKIYFIPFIIFTFIYSGIGICWEDVNKLYFNYYSIYVLIVGATTYFICHNKKQDVRDNTIFTSDRINTLIGRYGDFFIYFYLILCFVPLVYPSVRLGNLISPPRNNLAELFNDSYGVNESSLIITIVSFLKSLVQIFYYLSLYKYRKNISKFILFIFIPNYLSLANGYVSRSAMMCSLAITVIVFLIYYPKYRKKMLICGVCLTPLLIYGLSFYTYYRQGIDEINLSMSDAGLILLRQETAYPRHFDDILNSGGYLIGRYFEWIANLPLPFNFANNDYDINGIISETIAGIPRGEQGFNVLLPGVVGESLFIFGPYLYWIHAVIYGVIIGFVYRLLHHKNEIILLIYYSFVSAYTISRAGTISMYPFYFKHLLIYLILRYFIFKYKRIFCGNYRLL